MHLTVKAFATLSAFAPAGGGYEAEPPLSVGDLATRLGIPLDELHLVFVNNVRAELDRALADGDRVGFFPAVGGG
ncbi:MAG: MoaD/ThiS family protein [Desulfovibrionaceae bacterium]